MKSGPVLYLHAGRPKTASTFLQRSLFPTLSFLEYVEKPAVRGLTTPVWYGGLNSVFMRSPSIWDVRGNQLFAEIIGKGRYEQEPMPSILVSDEGVAGSIGLNPNDQYYWRDPALMARHLEKIRAIALDWGFVDVRLLFIFRRQDQMIASIYAQLSDRRPNASQRDFDHCVDQLLDPGSGFFKGAVALKYDIVQAEIIRSLGEPAVTMLAFEMLKTDPSSFGGALSGFFGINQTLKIDGRGPQDNVRSSSENTWSIRPRSQIGLRTIDLVPKAVAWRLKRQKTVPIRAPEFARGRSFKLSDKQSEAIRAAFEPSNRTLSKRLGIDLSRYGYY